MIINCFNNIQGYQEKNTKPSLPKFGSLSNSQH